VKSLRERQVRATFSAPDTKIARVRESLIGSYRNQLQDLSVRKNARLCFEYEVSSFESKGARISKVYDSIKRGDIRKRDNNLENKMAWGDRGADNWGLEITAAGTSQLCTACKSWASLDVSDSADYELFEHEDGLLSAKLDSHRVVRLYASKNNAGDVVKGKDLKGMIYKAMRPNADGAGMDIVKHSYNWADLEKDFGAKKRRGNMALYVCPYVDCRHIADADLQAAFNVAVRGYTKSVNPERARRQGDKGLNARFLSEEVKGLDFDPVCL
ncbi:MAG: type V CRISPR-associated protein Cas12d, partial [Coriobacteriia bacterium]|nr:type V CRISPR-associated protein Cas12d [Coriobacteriia bacterium]